MESINPIRLREANSPRPRSSPARVAAITPRVYRPKERTQEEATARFVTSFGVVSHIVEFAEVVEEEEEEEVGRKDDVSPKLKSYSIWRP